MQKGMAGNQEGNWECIVSICKITCRIENDERGMILEVGVVLNLVCNLKNVLRSWAQKVRTQF
jgi:hypothetical protein